MERQFDVKAPDWWWVSDSTDIQTQEGCLFLAVMMDLFAGNIVGRSIAARMTDERVLDALTTAYWWCKPTGMVMLHSDQGSEYPGGNCQRRLKSLAIRPSMSRWGNCHDTVVTESFFANMKKEKIRKGSIAAELKQGGRSSNTLRCSIIQSGIILTMVACHPGSTNGRI